MWIPKQLLHGKIVDALFMGGFSKLQIEFLGWLSFTAAALNRSRNPVKAAHTLLAKDSVIKMLEKFAQRKRDSIAPVETEHSEADAIFADLKDTIDDAVVRAKMRAATFEDFSKGGVSDGGEPHPEEEDKPVNAEPFEEVGDEQV